MSLWTVVRGWFPGAATQQKRGEQQPTPGGYVNRSAKAVTEDSALNLSAVWACVRLYSETVATLPLNVYRKDGDRLTKAPDHRLWHLLHSKPNRHMDAVQWRETMMLNLLLHGNCYAQIDRNARNEVVALWPLAANQVRVELLSDGSTVYAYAKDSDVAVIASQNMLHIRLMGNGLIGLSPIAYARNSIGLASATEDYATSFYCNGGRPGGVLTLDKILKEEQREQLRKSFSGLNEGSENAHRLMILEGGMKYDQVQVAPNDMQVLESRRFAVEEVCRWFNVDPMLVGHTEKTTSWGSGVEQFMLAFYTLKLRPMLERWEAAVATQLLTPAERRRYLVQFDFEALLRADTKTQIERESKEVQNALKTRNEIRAKKGLSPLPGGDVPTAQTNLAPLEMLGDPALKRSGSDNSEAIRQ